MKDASAAALSYEFEQEAEKLLRAEHQDSLTTLSSLACKLSFILAYVTFYVAKSLFQSDWLTLVVLTYTKGSHGQSVDGSRRCAEQTLQMGRRMKLFGVHDSVSIQQIQSLSECHQRFMQTVCWGAFNTVL